jgi:ankyrin repeat protein
MRIIIDTDRRLHVVTRSHITLALILAIPVASLFGAAPDTRLPDAAKNADMAKVSTLLKQRVDVNARQGDGTTALEWAVEHDDLPMAKLLIAAGADVKVVNTYGMSALTSACINANPAMVEMLLKAGADPNTVFSEGETAIMTAARTGNVQVVKLLFDAGGNANAKEPNKNQTAMMWAATEGHADVVKFLVSHEADFKAKALGGYDAMMYATREGRNGVVKELLDAGIDPNEKTTEGMTLLNLAIFNAHYDTAALLVNRGADVNIADRQQGVPLANLMKMRRMGGCQSPCPKATGPVTALELAQLLLDKGADANARTGAGRGGTGGFGNGNDVIANIGALKAEMAIKADPKASGDFYKYAGLFDQGGAGVQGGNFQNNYNLSTLSAATQAAILAATKADAAAGADVNADMDADAAAAAKPVVPRGRGAPAPQISLFQLALMNADPEIAKLLLAKGAKPITPLDKGVTTLMLAAGPSPTGNEGLSTASNHDAFELVKMVYDLGATDVNATDESGATALHAAARRGSKEIIQFLVDHGAKLDVNTNFGWTPLDAARGYRDYLGVGRRVMRGIAMQPDVASFIEKLMKDRQLPTEHFTSVAAK